MPYPTPVAIVEEPEPRTDETIGATLVPEDEDAHQPRTPQVGALAKAIDMITFFTFDADGSELNRPALDVATELLSALAREGWRLIHD